MRTFFFKLFIIVGLAVTAIMFYMQQSSKQSNADQNAMGQIVYATKDIPEGSEITCDALDVKDELQRIIPAQVVTSPSAAVGQVAAYEILAGSIVMVNALRPSSVRKKRR